MRFEPGDPESGDEPESPVCQWRLVPVLNDIADATLVLTVSRKDSTISRQGTPGKTVDIPHRLFRLVGGGFFRKNVRDKALARISGDRRDYCELQ